MKSCGYDRWSFSTNQAHGHLASPIGPVGRSDQKFNVFICTVDMADGHYCRTALPLSPVVITGIYLQVETYYCRPCRILQSCVAT
ncbi:hypothetical protein J6590_028642 [Homalodisca vitripennis]|nr:hypothetical protein J6590_028642 [Homalodisca vitripennis]